MRTTTGIFRDADAACTAVRQLQAIIGDERISALTPRSPETSIHSVPTTQDMPPVVGPIGGVLGGALGVGTAMMIPGIGPLTVFGLAAMAILGAGGGIAGWHVGDLFDRAGCEGIPEDELYLYEDALAKGRIVVIASIEPENEAEVRRIFAEAGAESINAAREDWWLGLRDAEEAQYHPPDGGTFGRDEAVYRKGFESALLPRMRGKRYDEVVAVLIEVYGEESRQPPFRSGFGRGQDYLRRRETDASGDPPDRRQHSGSRGRDR